MNYEEFKPVRLEMIKSGYKDYANTDLYNYFKNPVVYKKGTGHIDGVVYRCHLVEDWLKFYGLPNELKKYIGVSSGVRNSLSVLSQYYKNKNWMIPRDVYPTYQKILNDNSCKYSEYSTLGLDNIFSFLEKDNNQILLITNPLKPNGTMLNTEDFKLINDWFSQDKDRILVVDCAYMLSKIDKDLLNLYATNQVILLFSLSKLWLIPNYFGVSLFPNNEAGLKVREEYKKLEKNQDKLNTAYAALNDYVDYPEQLRLKIIEKIKEANKDLSVNFEINEDNPSYLFYDKNSVEYWKEKNVVVVPASVFGGSEGCVVSILD